MSVGNPHIGKSDFNGSMSIWIQSIASTRLAYCGTKGTSVSSSSPTSACSSRGRRIETGEARRILRNIEIDRIELGNPDAAGKCQALQRRDRVGVASEIGRQRDRIFRGHQSRGDGIHASRIDAAGRHAAIARGIVGRHLRFVPFLGQRLARQHHVDRPGRIAMHEGAGAGERFLHDDAGGQGILPFDIGPHDAGDVEGVLHEVHIGVARSRQFAMQREGCAPANSITGSRYRNRFWIAMQALAVPASTCTNTACPLPVARAYPPAM